MKKHTITTFEEAESYINETPRFTTKHTMEDTRAFLHRLGDPDRKMKMIHVAGTNGKGSVCAYLRSILETAGYRVALFTSPHLVDIRERFMVSGELISREDFLRIFLMVYEVLDWAALEKEQLEEEEMVQATLEKAVPEQEPPKAYHPSYFEYLFFMAMLYFGEKNPDFCILETGLGGRLDATNAVSQKSLAVITRIGLDHVEYLGDTLAQIAGEKAGIMAADTPAVIWDTCPECTAVFREKAESLGICAHFVSEKDYSFGKNMNKTIDFSLRTGYYGYISLILRTIAVYQMENAALAVRAIEALDRGRTVTAEHVQAGVEACFWAGRMEEVLPEVYVDGAHNEDGIRAFLETVAQDGLTAQDGSTDQDGISDQNGQNEIEVSGAESQGCRLRTGRILLFGAVKDKDCESMVRRLAESGLFDRIAVTCLRTERGVPAKTLKQLFSRYLHCTVQLYGSVREALTSLLSDRQPGERIYAAGSLYLAGEIKELFIHDKF